MLNFKIFILKNKEAIIKLLFFYILIKIIAWVFGLIVSSSFFQVFELEQFASNDISLNDLYYKAKLKEKPDEEKDINKYTNEILIINSGTIKGDSSRLQFSHLINKIMHFKPAVVALDHYFEKKNKIGNDSLMNTFHDFSNIIVGNSPNNNNLFNKQSQLGNLDLPEGNTKRYYFNNSNTLAYKVAFKAKKTAHWKIDDESFPINYVTYLDGIYPYFPESDEVSCSPCRSNFRVIEASDLLNDHENDFVIEDFKDKIVLIGHVGPYEYSQKKFDIQDKFKVPTDTVIINRDKSMYGVIIHANAILNIIHPEIKFKEFKGIWFDLFKVFIELSYLSFLLFIRAGKLTNLFLLIAISTPFLFIVIYLMTFNIYISIGLALLQLLIMEELIDIIEPIWEKIKKFKK